MSKWVEIKMNDKLKNFIKSGGKEAHEGVLLALEDLGVTGEAAAKQYQYLVKTGRLRSSIHWENHKTNTHQYKDSHGVKYTGTFMEKTKEGEVKIGTNVEYAWPIEARIGFMQQTYQYLVGIIDMTFAKYLKFQN